MVEKNAEFRSKLNLIKIKNLMKENTLFHKNYQYLAIILSIIVSLVFVAMGVFATTIDTNVSTGTITGSSATLSSTLAVTGLAPFTAAVNASSTVNMDGNLTVAGRATTTASSGNFATAGTLAVTSSTTLSSTLRVAGNITSGSGAKIAVASSSPTTELTANGAATTTLMLASSGALIGGCIELRSASGTPYRMYIGGNDYATVTGVTGRAGLEAVWEAGHCK